MTVIPLLLFFPGGGAPWSLIRGTSVEGASLWEAEVEVTRPRSREEERDGAGAWDLERAPATP